MNLKKKKKDKKKDLSKGRKIFYTFKNIYINNLMINVIYSNQLPKIFFLQETELQKYTNIFLNPMSLS